MKRILLVSLFLTSMLFANEVELMTWNKHKATMKEKIGKFSVVVYDRLGLAKSAKGQNQEKIKKTMIKNVCKKPSNVKLINSGTPYLYFFVYRDGTISVLIDKCN